MNKRIIGTLMLMLLFFTPLTNVLGNVINNNTEMKQIYEFKPGEIILKLADGIKISNNKIHKINDKYKVYSTEKVFKNSQNTILDNIYLIQVPIKFDIFSIIDEYSLLPEVTYAEPNGIFHLCSIPNDENFSKQWGLHNTGQDGGTPDADIDAPEAWNISTGSSDVVVALIDSGIDYTHPDLEENIWVNEDEIPDNDIDDDENGYIDDIISWDFIENDADPKDLHSHGTHCSGITCAVTNNDIGIAGIACDCKVMPVRIADVYWDTTLDIVAKGIKYAADNGADVISMSFGWYSPYNLLEDAVDYAYERDVVLVASAGNDGIQNKIYPAAFSNVIGVAGINRNNNRLNYYYEIVNVWIISNYGSWVDVAAPAQEIFSTMPTYNVLYNSILGLDLNYDYLTGTSMAAPLVAGLAALIKSRNHSLKPSEIKSIIIENVEPYDSEYDLGSGCVNAYKVLKAINQPPDKPEIDGPTNGNVGVEYPYTFVSNDPEYDDIYYWIDWGDGCPVVEWIGPYDSDEEVILTHTFSKGGQITIRAQTEDLYGARSDFGSLVIEIPRSRNQKSNYFSNMLSYLFNLFPLGKKILLKII
jgi:subtilisin family serine protease